MTERPSVLLIDDDSTLRELLAHQFQLAGYGVRACADGTTGLESFLADRPDLVVLDVMMPGTDGWAVCGEVRRVSDTPVILLTARSMELDKLTGFRLGADDYLTKPFSVAELLARAAAVLARYQATGRRGEGVESDDLAIAFRSRRVRLDGEEVALTPTEYRLLEAVARRGGDPVATEHLLREVWGPLYAGETDLVKHFVWSLRRKLEKDPSRPRHIRTVRGYGYRFD